MPIGMPIGMVRVKGGERVHQFMGFGRGSESQVRE